MNLDWEGTWNTRVIAPWLVRSGSLDGLTARGWASAIAFGIRTVIDLRDERERAKDASGTPPEITRVSLPLDGKGDRGFWDKWEDGAQYGTPLYYGPHIARMPERSARVLSAIARAPGGVLFHCGAGRDRAGQIAMLALHLRGVSAEAIGADYVLSYGRARPDHTAELRAFLTEQGTSAEQEIARILREGDVLAHLERGGLTAEDLALLRAR